MILGKRLKTNTLLRLGLVALALRGVLQHFVNSAGRSTDLTDFAVGMLMGVGIALLSIVAWRKGHGESVGGCGAR